MPNFYSDNDDIRFLCRHYDLGRLADIMEGEYAAAGKHNWAPADANDAVDNYDRILDIVGQVSGELIAPRAEAIDRTGNTLNADGSVSRPSGMDDNLRDLARAEVMGFTLPYRFGGLNCPNFVYTVANEIVSRADAALMNIFGLQGIAETINAFASEEIKQQYLPPFAEGKYTGAMVLTEPDAGSDLQAVKLRAYQDGSGQWLLHGVKRFITNGCGEVLLVLARSEPDRSGGLGLSLFVCKPGPTVKIRRLEDKLGIHGSPTCEIFFDNTPCQLIGERQRGLVTYVMSLMNGARVGIAAQSLGIAEAAYREARNYAASRVQFGVSIDNLPAVRDLLVEMRTDVEVARSLTAETCWWVDQEYGAARALEAGTETDKAKVKELKQQEKICKRFAGMLTPMAKYYASEMSNRVTYNAMQVLGGSGYMKDYPVERLSRDARITTIYEGTSQLQIIAAVRGVCGGTGERFIEQLADFPFEAEQQELVNLLAQGTREMVEAVAFIKSQPGTDYMDLHGRKIVDVAIMVIVGYLFLRQCAAAPRFNDAFTQAGENDGVSDYDKVREHKRRLADRYIRFNAPLITGLTAQICLGNRASLAEFNNLVGPAA